MLSFQQSWLRTSLRSRSSRRVGSLEEGDRQTSRPLFEPLAVGSTVDLRIRIDGDAVPAVVEGAALLTRAASL